MTFTEWQGQMDWPLGADWECEICGQKPLVMPSLGYSSGLEWGLIHGLCRCTKCHAKYNMRDRDGQRVTKPRSLLKPKYREAAKLGWEPLGLPLDEWTDHMWTVALEWVKKGEAGEQPKVPVFV